MEIPELQEFAQRLMQRVRDMAIQNCDMLATLKGPRHRAVRWRKAAQSGSPQTLLREAIPDIVGNTLFYLLYAIDEGWLKLTYTAENGKTISLHEGLPGELAGLMHAGPEGWITEYSRERSVDDCPDLVAHIRQALRDGI